MPETIGLLASLEGSLPLLIVFVVSLFVCLFDRLFVRSFVVVAVVVGGGIVVVIVVVVVVGCC